MHKLTLAALVTLLASPAFADDAAYTITIKDHTFEPATLEVPAGKPVKLLVKNLDATPEEFESKDLKREKVIKGNSEITVLLGELKPGEYKFVGEYNEDTAKGVIVAK